MKVFVFDLLAYGENLDHLKEGQELPYPAAQRKVGYVSQSSTDYVRPENQRAAGANTVQIGFNRGAMPHDMFMNQIRRFAADVLPRLQAHKVATVPLVEEAA